MFNNSPLYYSTLTVNSAIPLVSGILSRLRSVCDGSVTETVKKGKQPANGEGDWRDRNVAVLTRPDAIRKPPQCDAVRIQLFFSQDLHGENGLLVPA